MCAKGKPHFNVGIFWVKDRFCAKKRLTNRGVTLYTKSIMHPVLFEIGNFTASTYGFLVAAGIVAALAMFWFLCKRTKVDPKVYSFYSILGVVSVGMGLFGAWFFQMIYYAVANGRFSPNAGLTFMGGVVMGTLTFCVGAALFAKKPIQNEFWRVSSLAGTSVPLALALGRMGCFFVGCSFGIDVDRFGVIFIHGPSAGRRVLPTNLMEAIFAFLLCLVLLVLILRYKKGHYNLFIFGGAYSIWRFIIEFFRADNRHQSGALTPSQIQSIVWVCVVIAIVVMVVMRDRLHPRLQLFLKYFKNHPLGAPITASAVQNDSAILANTDTVANAEVVADTTTNTVQANTTTDTATNADTAQTQTEVVKIITSSSTSADIKFEQTLRYVFLGSLAAAGLFLILAIVFIITGSVALWFMYMLSGLFLVAACATMPVASGHFDAPKGYGDIDYDGGTSLIGRLMGGRGEEQGDNN